MDLSLAALRQHLLDLRAWDAKGQAQRDRIRRCINLALRDLCGLVPEALVPATEHAVLLPDITGTDATVSATLNTSSSGFVLQFLSATGTALSSWTPDTNGYWDWRYHIEAQDNTGRWHRREAREFFVVDTPPTTAYYVTLDRPWPSGRSDTLMPFRLHQPFFSLSSAVTRIFDPIRLWHETKQTAWSLSAGSARAQQMTDFRGETRGVPSVYFREDHFQLPAPRRAPTLNLQSPVGGSPVGWQGPLPSGEFSFCYTIVAGKRDEEWQQAPGGLSDPLYESAPSPVSAKVDAGADTPTPGILIQCLNIDAMTNYDVSGTLRETHSGYRIRIYVARHSIDSKSGQNAYKPIEASGIYYLLTEIAPTDEGVSGIVASYLWRGDVLPDYYRPLRRSSGYYRYRTWPHADQRYEMDLPVARLPDELIDDADVAPIQQDAIAALTELALAYAALVDGNDMVGNAQHLAKAEAKIRRLRTAYGNDAKVVEPTPLNGITPPRRYSRFTSE